MGSRAFIKENIPALAGTAGALVVGFATTLGETTANYIITHEQQGYLPPVGDAITHGNRNAFALSWTLFTHPQAAWSTFNCMLTIPDPNVFGLPDCNTVVSVAHNSSFIGAIAGLAVMGLTHLGMQRLNKK